MDHLILPGRRQYFLQPTNQTPAERVYVCVCISGAYLHIQPLRGNQTDSNTANRSVCFPTEKEKGDREGGGGGGIPFISFFSSPYKSKLNVYPRKDTKQIYFHWRIKQEARGLTPSLPGTGSPLSFSNVSSWRAKPHAKRLWQIFPADETAEQQNGEAREKEDKASADVTQGGGGGVLPSDVWSQRLLHGDWSVTAARHLVQLPPGGHRGAHMGCSHCCCVRETVHPKKKVGIRPQSLLLWARVQPRLVLQSWIWLK